ncbi:hypothetical protein JOF56_004269 [Kibdelosporangium banguiense]|uniref:ABC transporter permease n=1 Tax=Kibdelosporangium banguiense TaxID=1365924 RepID=A0ABS4THL1_9PSEU|nr:hypothetical protein [Kibdelosporangium banguiense]MBP2323884.1 hypothetical protein [Kibdelosporangium banguiense]
MTESPAELLGDLRRLRSKVRRDRHGYALPLLMFGVLILAASLCYADRPWPDPIPAEGVYFESVPGPFPAFEYRRALLVHNPLLIQWYWMLTLLIGFAVTTWWYRRRAELIGVETDLRGCLITAGAALTGLVFGVPVLETTAAPRNTLYSTPDVNLPILIISAVASAAVFFVGVRWKRLRELSLFVGTLLATVAFAAVGVYMINGLSALLVVAAALLFLAWIERSVLLGVVGVLFTAAALHANLEGLSEYLSSGLRDVDGRLILLQDLALPGAVLLLGGLVAVAQSKRATR